MSKLQKRCAYWETDSCTRRACLMIQNRLVLRVDRIRRRLESASCLTTVRRSRLQVLNVLGGGFFGPFKSGCLMKIRYMSGWQLGYTCWSSFERYVIS